MAREPGEQGLIEEPLWWQELEPLPPAGDPLPAQSDVLVIGAGYTGLSAARVARDGGATVAVIDALPPGLGASSRNGGMMGAHPRLSWETLARTFGEELADRLFAEAAPALAWVREMIAEEGTACDLEEAGRLQLAWTPGHWENLQHLAGRLAEKTTVKARLIPKAALAEEIRTECYFGALLLEEHCAVQPAKYHRGLLEAVRRRGVPVAWPVRADAVTREGGRFRVRTGAGEIRAETVILATNGYTGAPFSWHSRRVFPLPSFIIATEETDPDRLLRLAPGRRMMVETRKRHSYFRLSPDGRRVVFGGRAATVPIAPARAAAWLRETMCGIWPDLADLRITHAWSGFTGFTFHHTPHVGTHEGIHFAMGYSGSGTVMAPWLGAKAAWRALGDPRGETAYADTTPATHWAHRFARPWFLYPVNAWYRGVVDRWENLQARAGRR